MRYDIPEVGLSVEGTPQVRSFNAGDTKDYGAAQMQEQGAATSKTGTSIAYIQDVLNDARAKELDNQLADHVREALYDPENGYLGTAGKTAVDARSGVIKSLQDKVKEIEQGAKNDMQKALFGKAARARLQSAYLHIDGHALNQAKIYGGAEAKARMDGARLDAVQNWAGWEDPGGVYARSKALMSREARAVASVAGIPEDSEQYKLLTQGALTQLHADVINNMISLGQTGAAKKYYANAVSNKEILPDKLDELNSKVKMATTATEADNLASQVWSEFMSGKNRNEAVSLFQMTERVRTLAGDNEDVQKSAIAGIKERYGEWNGEQAEFKAQNISGVWKQIDAGVPMKKMQLSPSWMALSDTERHQIRKEMEAEAATRAARNAANSSRELTDLQRQEHLNFLKNGDSYLTVTDPNVLKRMSRAQVEALRGKFGMEPTKQLLDKWDAIQDPRKYGEAKMDTDDFNAVARSLKLDPLDTKNKEMRNKVGALRFHVEQVLNLEQIQKKAPLTRQEKMEIINKEMSRQVLVNPGYFSTNKKVPVITLTAKQAEKVVIPNIDRKNIAEAMKIRYNATGDASYAPTEANLRRFYLMSISPGGAATFQGAEE